MHTKDEETEEDCDANQRDGGGCREELAVVDSEVPDHSEQDHKYGDDETPCAESHTG